MSVPAQIACPECGAKIDCLIRTEHTSGWSTARIPWDPALGIFNEEGAEEIRAETTDSSLERLGCPACDAPLFSFLEDAEDYPTADGGWAYGHRPAAEAWMEGLL